MAGSIADASTDAPANAVANAFQNASPIAATNATTTQHNSSTHRYTGDIVIVGAGLAGCWLARTLAERNIAVVLLEQNQQPASSASGNSAGIFKPAVSRAPGFAQIFYQQAHQHLLDRLARWQLLSACQFSQCGVLQLTNAEFPSHDSYCRMSADAAGSFANLAIPSAALQFPDSGWLNPHRLCHALLNHPLISLHTGYRVQSLSPDQNSQHWTIQSDTGLPEFSSTQLILTSGHMISRTAWTDHLPLVAARGQTSRFRILEKSPRLQSVVSGRHYVIADGDYVHVGASFDRHDESLEIRQSDHAANLKGVRQMLPSLQLADKAVDGFVGIRATLPDRLPVCGPVPDAAACAHYYRDIHHGRRWSTYPPLPVIPGLLLLGGLGSRGITSSAYLAQLLSNYLLGAEADHLSATANATAGPHHSLESFGSLLNPVRFQIRNLKRQR